MSARRQSPDTQFAFDKAQTSVRDLAPEAQKTRLISGGACQLVVERRKQQLETYALRGQKRRGILVGAAEEMELQQQIRAKVADVLDRSRSQTTSDERPMRVGLKSVRLGPRVLADAPTGSTSPSVRKSSSAR